MQGEGLLSGMGYGGVPPPCGTNRRCCIADDRNASLWRPTYSETSSIDSTVPKLCCCHRRWQQHERLGDMEERSGRNAGPDGSTGVTAASAETASLTCGGRSPRRCERRKGPRRHAERLVETDSTASTTLAMVLAARPLISTPSSSDCSNDHLVMFAEPTYASSLSASKTLA